MSEEKKPKTKTTKTRKVVKKTSTKKTVAAKTKVEAKTKVVAKTASTRKRAVKKSAVVRKKSEEKPKTKTTKGVTKKRVEIDKVLEKEEKKEDVSGAQVKSDELKKSDSSEPITSETESLITMDEIEKLKHDRDSVLAEAKKEGDISKKELKQALNSADDNRVKVHNDDKLDELVLKGGDVKSVLTPRKKEENIPVKEEEKRHVEEIEEAIIDNMSANRSVGIYRKIALSFILLTAILLVVIFYFSFTKVTITLIPNQERVSNNLIFDIYDTENADSISSAGIPGIVREIVIENTKEYPATGSNVIGKEVVGKVDIVNNYNKNQPLVASTRLLTPDGKLFRLKETINVPVGGIEGVDIYADVAKPEMAIGPTKFIIPGLWAGIQDKIYAQSNTDIVYRQKIKKYILESDIDNAEMDLKEELLTSVKSKVNDIYKNYEQVIFKIDEKSIESEADRKVDEEVDMFNVFMEAKVMVVAFNDETASRLAKNKFISSLPDNKELISFDDNNIIYSLSNYNSSESIASVNATFEGKASLKGGSNIIDVEKILGLNQKQLETYLGDMPEIAGFEIEFYPKFIRKVPKLVDKINIVIKK